MHLLCMSEITRGELVLGRNDLLPFEYYRQVYFVHSGLQDESLQVTISKLP